MDTLEQISKRCLAVCQVSKHISIQAIQSTVKCHRPQAIILDVDQVHGIESNKTLTRWILYMNSAEDVEYMCHEVKTEDIKEGGQSCTVTYQPAIACELPERWEHNKEQGSESYKPESTEVIPSQAESHKHMDKDLHQVPKPTRRHHVDSHQVQQRQWPVGPYGAMSGFYPNIPGSEQLQTRDGRYHNQGQVPQGPMMRPPPIPIPSGPGNMQNQGLYDMPFQSPPHGRDHNQGQVPHGPMMRLPPIPLPSGPGNMQNQGLYDMPFQSPTHGRDHNQGQVPQGPMMRPPPIPLPSGPGYMQNQGLYDMPFQSPPHGRGQPDQNYQFSSIPRQFPPGFQQNMLPGQQNMPQQHYMMPMCIDPQTGQLVPMPGNPQIHQQAADNRRSPLPNQAPPPPYNSPEHRENKHFKHTDVRSPAYIQDSGSKASSKAVSDQDNMLHRLQSKINQENIGCRGQEGHPQEGPRQEGQRQEESDGTKEIPAPGETKEREMKIIVSNLPKSVHEEYLETFFESTKKFGGGPVFHVEYDEENASAVVEFEEPEAVDVVMQKGPIIMMGQTVEVKVYVPEESTPICTIEVTGPCSIVSEEQLETLEMYFENTRRSGGDDVVTCVFDSGNNMALVTFETEEVAQRVEERPSHIVKKEKLMVKLHVPAKHSQKSQVPRNDSTEESVPEEPHCTIKVKGVENSASRDTIEFYFENSRRSGGGEIESVKSDSEEEDVIYVTFKSEQVAQKVVKQTHKIEEKQLIVTLHIPPTPPPSYENKALIKGLKSSTTEDCLFNFIEAKTGCIPERMNYHAEQDGVVMVTFEEIPEFDKLENVLGKNKLEGVFLKIYPVPISNCIIVTNLSADVTKDTVEFYFENTRRSGGGTVDKVVMNDDDTCLVYFNDYTVIDTVLQRKHTLNSVVLDVMRYQECLGRPEGETTERELFDDIC